MARAPGRTVLLLACALVAANAAAQSSDAIVPDRPDLTDAPTVVAPRVVQVETGGLWERDAAADGTATRLSAPNLLVRLGMTRRLELRIGMQGLVRDRSGRPGAPWRTSASDTEVGVKYQLAHQDGLGFDLGVEAFVGVPTGGAASSGNVDPSLKLAWGTTLGAASVTGNLNWSSPTTPDDQRQRVVEGTVSVGRGLWGRWSAFWEAVVSAVDDPDVPAAWTVNTGVTRLFGNDLQVDLHVGRGLNETASDWAAGAGVAYRFRRALSRPSSRAVAGVADRRR